MIDPCDFRALFEEVNDFQCIAHLALYPETEGFETLEKDPCRDRRKGGSLVSEDHSPRPCHEGCSSRHFGENGSMITRIRLGQGRKLVGVGFPVEVPAVHDDSAQSASVSADEFGRRVDDDVCSVLDRPYEIRGSEGVVDKEGKAVSMGYFCQGVNVGYI